MIPNIPDNLFKITFALGLFLIGYSYIQTQREVELGRTYSRRFDLVKDSILFQERVINQELKSVEEHSLELSQRYGVKNPMAEKGGNVYFDKTFRGDKSSVIVSDEIEKLWNAYKAHKFLFHESDLKAGKELDRINEDITDNNKDSEFWNNAVGLGAVLFVIGIFGLLHLQGLQNKLLVKQIKSGEQYSCCQSCGKSFNATVQNAKFNDGEINYYYCRECFQNDEFTNPELTLKQAYKNYLRIWEKPGLIAKLTARAKIVNLHRWRFGRY
ncbi:MAG: zinc ribbon domain-containing protein [Sphingobacteriales bacterium]